ncbi:single-stranded DNA-binding protein [Clostridium sp. WILCCON 0269]|uniref:Single-stranded DNA-binding protein n=1 Tax=Candidatus Clostridium eludens TaxID=3381663 RepID=A0ABW8SLB4_9CLOT
MNKVVLIGRLTKDPDLRFTPGKGTPVARITVAVDRRFSKDGQKEADFIPVIIWGKQAESTANYMAKGRLIGISGRIQTRSYEAKDSTRKYVTEVIADEVQFLEWGKKSEQQKDNLDLPDEVTPVDDGDIPF